MKTYKVILFNIIALTFAACNSGQKQSNTDTLGDTIQAYAKTTDTVKSDLAHKMLGAWSAIKGDTGKVTFIITDTTFFYPATNINHRYEVLGDSVKIHFNNFADTFGVEINGTDTLRLTGGEDGPGIYKRVTKVLAE
ncbi:MAG: hypothetical protein EOP46_17115 [Sphingobacteriaceae bacterium]|nr:MAG: hypothetical protein EOP46_17115 [Sphingobacteriaceae bacterium]